MPKRPEPHPTQPRLFESAAALSDALRADIETAILAVATGSGPSVRLSAFKAPAGAGKSRIMCELLARHGADLLQRGHVVVHVPTLDLANQMAARFAEIGSGLPTLVLRGRSAEVDGAPLCEHSTIAERLGGVAPSVSAALCEGRGCDGRPAVADCRDGCRWWAQFPPPGEGARIVFTTHAFLTLPLSLPGPIALRFVDETFWQSLCRIETISLERFLVSRSAPGDRKDDRLIRARATVYEALMTGAGVMGALRRKRFAKSELVEFARMEMTGVTPPTITPTMSMAVQRAALGRFDFAAFTTARLRAAIWRSLAETPAKRETQRVNLVIDGVVAETGALRPMVTLHTVECLPDDAPMIAIDADADHEILAALTSEMTFRAYRAPALAEVVQITDLTMSQQHLLDPKDGRNRREAVMRLVAGEVAIAPNHRVLLVTNRAVLEALHDDAGAASEDPERLLRQLCGADCRWFGPSIRGTDVFCRT